MTARGRAFLWYQKAAWSACLPYAHTATWKLPPAHLQPHLQPPLQLVQRIVGCGLLLLPVQNLITLSTSNTATIYTKHSRPHTMAVADALSATDILTFVCILTWNCLCDTPFMGKNVLFARFFTSLDMLTEIASAASLCFAPGLLDVVQAAAPPSITFFKSLPTDTFQRWAIYALVLEKDGCRPRLYIGSATNLTGGVRARLKQYDDGFLIPEYVQKSLDEGFVIEHKGLLCWISIPTASMAPIRRLLFFALEATFSFLFWAMKARLGDYSMGHICLWGRFDMEYTGLCSHCCLNEAIIGDFDMTAEQLEAQAADKEAERVALKAENATNWHHKQMETNYADYMEDSLARVQKSRANNPGRDAKIQAARSQKAREEDTFPCTDCNLSYGKKQNLDIHLASERHRRKVNGEQLEFYCDDCDLGYHNKSNLTRHNKSEKHKDNVAASSSAPLE